MITNILSNSEIEKTRLAFETAGTIKGAAKLLGIAHRTMQHRMKYVKTDIQPKFTAPELPSSLPSIEELLEQRTAQGDRSIAADEARHLEHLLNQYQLRS